MRYKIKLEKPVVLVMQLAVLAFLWSGVYVFDALVAKSSGAGYGLIRVYFEAFAVIWGLACIMWSANYISKKNKKKNSKINRDQ